MSWTQMNLSNSTVRLLNPTLVAPMIEVTSKQNWKHSKKINFAWIFKNHYFQWSDKVNIFREGHKNLAQSFSRFGRCYLLKSNVQTSRKMCAKFLWPSQKTWTVTQKKKHLPLFYGPVQSVQDWKNTCFYQSWVEILHGSAETIIWQRKNYHFTIPPGGLQFFFLFSCCDG